MRNNVIGAAVSLLLTGLAMGQSVPRWEPRDFSFKSSTEHNNPFAVTFSATAKAPNGETLHLPGFYDGDGTWTIRFAPVLEGKWSLTTDSDDLALAGKRVELTCAGNSNPNVHGPLQVDREHPHWFAFADGSHGYILGYEADWLWALDMTAPDTPTLNAFLDKLKRHGFNYIVLNAYAHDTSWRKGRTSEQDYGPPPMFAWEGTNENPDHSRFNLAYWRHFDRMMNALHERGIIAHLMFKVSNKSVNWPASGSTADDLWFQWILARYAAYPNLVWDFAKEAYYEKNVDYKISRLKLIRANDPYRHLITIHDDYGYDKGTFDEVVDFQADQNHGAERHKTILAQRSRRQWPVMNIEFGYEHGPGGPQDKTYGVVQSPEVVCQRAWELATAGAYLTYYYTYTAWDVLRTEDTPPGYEYFKVLHDFWNSVPYWTMKPADHLVDQGYCLADEGRHYVVYLPDGGPVNLTLGNSQGRLKVEWLHPFTGQRVAGELVAQDKCLLTPPAEFGKTPTVLHVSAIVSAASRISGELKTWHKVTLTFDGPATGESGDPNPFLDYRLNVTFEHPDGGRRYVVPGYYAADGDAANTSADSGNKWRVHFAPDRTGPWKYRVSFRQGKNVAVSEDPEAGASAGFMDGRTGSFAIAPTDKSGRDLRGKGRLAYVGKHHLRFAGTGEYFLKCGADAPENFLAYADFDGDFKTDGRKDNLVKTWEPHIRDWKPGDPTWQNGKGKGIIGAVNYLAGQGMNVFSFLPMNIEGDDRNVFPYTTYTERFRMDVSRLDQWEIVFEHGDRLGMYLHFKTLETENELLLDGGDLGAERKLYYRELIARFAHHLALDWNLGEEINNATHEQKVAWAGYFAAHDPYRHHLVIHNAGDPHYDLLGDASALTGFSLQTSKPDFSEVHRRTLDYIERSVAAGRPWVVACDEPGDASHALITDEEDPTRDNARKNALWGNLMAGGAGVEWYFGYKHPHSDLTCQDYRTRTEMWRQSRIALEFFDKHKIPFWDMKCEDKLTAREDDYCLVKPGEVYLVYLKNGGTVRLNATAGRFDYGWFNPRTGDGLDGLLQTGSVGTAPTVDATAPDTNDWLLVVRGKGGIKLSSE